MNEFTQAQITEHAQIVARGAKPCSVLPIKQADSIKAHHVVEQQGALSFLFTVNMNDEWCELWIYKHPEMLHIINQLPSKPKTSLDHFILGCVFGYSVDAIFDYIAKLDK